MNIVKDLYFDEERALYNLTDAKVSRCRFTGKQDGESPLKESRNIIVDKCVFGLRYPLWHIINLSLFSSKLNRSARAPLWYTENARIGECTIKSTKAVRECKNISINDCKITSEEFGWKCNNLSIRNSDIEGPYFLLDSRKIFIENVILNGKYSFQYTEDLEINNCTLTTKDAFWHTKNAHIKNSIIYGEYLGWYSENLTLENCSIIGLQPLCYCKGLKLINCTMTNCNLAFEYSEVDAQISSSIDSVKNPASGIIKAESIGQVIRENSVLPSTAEIICTSDK